MRHGSAFDPERQHGDVGKKLVASLERLGQTLRVLIWEQAQAHGLSPIQIQVLIFLLHHNDRLARVTQLAREFGLTAPTVSDAISALDAKGLISKATDDDRRSLILKLTPAGRRMADRLSGWADTLEIAIESIPAEEKQTALTCLMKLIEVLQRSGIVTVARMCLNCRFFAPNTTGSTEPHYCNLLKKPLAEADLRIDCPEHEPTQ